MRKSILVLIMAFLTSFSLTTAEAFPLPAVSADAKWLAHMDFNYLRQTEIGEKLYTEMQRGPVASRLEVLGNLLQMNPYEDIHAITLHGTDRERENAVTHIKADYNRDAVLAILKNAKEYRTEKYEGYTLHNFKPGKNHIQPEKGKSAKAWLCFYDDNTIVLGYKQSRVTTAIDVLQGEAETFDAEGKAAFGSSPDDDKAIFYAATSIPALDSDHEQAKLLQNAKHMTLSFKEKGENCHATMTIHGKDDEVARQIKQIADGMLAWLRLHSAQKPDETELALLSENTVVNRDGQIVEVQMAYPTADLVKLIEEQKWNK